VKGFPFGKGKIGIEIQRVYDNILGAVLATIIQSIYPCRKQGPHHCTDFFWDSFRIRLPASLILSLGSWLGQLVIVSLVVPPFKGFSLIIMKFK